MASERRVRDPLRIRGRAGWAAKVRKLLNADADCSIRYNEQLAGEMPRTEANNTSCRGESRIPAGTAPATFPTAAAVRSLKPLM
jgi:hypothetical protein